MTEMRLHEALSLSLDQARDMAAPYGIEVTSMTPLKGGLMNTNIRIDSDDVPYLLRVYNEKRSPAEIEFELSVLHRLAECGVPAQHPLRGGHGYGGEWNGRLYGLFTFLDGEALEEDALSAPVNVAIGEAVGQMQNAFEGFVPEGSKPRADVEFIDGLVSGSYNALREAGADELVEEIRRGWAEARAPFADDGLPLCVLHADLFPGNVIIKDDTFAGFIDFDDAYLGTSLFDVAIAAMQLSFTGETDLCFGLVQAFLDGYHKHRPQVDERLLVDAMRLNCFRFFTLTLPLTVGEGRMPADNVYLKRIRFFAEQTTRDTIIDSLR